MNLHLKYVNAIVRKSPSPQPMNHEELVLRKDSAIEVKDRDDILDIFEKYPINIATRNVRY
jgi:hypothetical protein